MLEWNNIPVGLRPLLQPLFTFQIIDEWIQNTGESGKSEALGEKSLPLSLYLPKIPDNSGSEARAARWEADRNRLSYDYGSYDLNKVYPLKTH
jgi:hypothetical protein